MILQAIHSKKGDEADIVYLVDGIPPAVQRTLHEPEHYDEELRVFFVGSTRAKQELQVVRTFNDYNIPFLL